MISPAVQSLIRSLGNEGQAPDASGALAGGATGSLFARLLSATAGESGAALTTLAPVGAGPDGSDPAGPTAEGDLVAALQTVLTGTTEELSALQVRGAATPDAVRKLLEDATAAVAGVLTAFDQATGATTTQSVRAALAGVLTPGPGGGAAFGEGRPAFGNPARGDEIGGTPAGAGAGVTEAAFVGGPAFGFSSVGAPAAGAAGIGPDVSGATRLTPAGQTLPGPAMNGAASMGSVSPDALAAGAVANGAAGSQQSGLAAALPAAPRPFAPMPEVSLRDGAVGADRLHGVTGLPKTVPEARDAIGTLGARLSAAISGTGAQPVGAQASGVQTSGSGARPEGGAAALLEQMVQAMPPAGTEARAPMDLGRIAALAAMPPPPEQASQAAALARSVQDQIRGTRLEEGKTRIELSPRGLGDIEIELSPDEAGKLRIVLRAENPAVLGALRGDREMLLTLLRDSGSRVDDAALSFEDMPGRDGGRQNGRGPSNAPSFGPGTPGPIAEVAADIGATHTDTRPRPEGGRLDILT